ncbi:MAG: DUF370 domain-containing protein [Thermaerobacter sp.]|nr:DUF370 domain-containing protein [Thermaerobacter sp.]
MHRVYLHIGREWMIDHGAIIGLFPLRILDSSPEFRHLFYSWRLKGQVLGDFEEAKTIILVDTHIFLSPISPHTLWRRTERGNFGFE